MNRAKFPAIAEKLERRIRDGGKLPPVRILASEFKVSLQTMTNARKKLIESGLISANRRQGTHCIVNAGHRGMIGVITVGDDPALNNSDNHFVHLLSQITADGFTPVLFWLPGNTAVSAMNMLSKCDWKGLIFTNGSISEELADFLDSGTIPYVSGTMLPLHKNLNFAEFDNLNELERLTEKIQAKGYRRIALVWHSNLDGYNKLIRSRWITIKRKLGLPEVCTDVLPSDSGLDKTEYYRNSLEMLHKNQPRLDIVILWGGTGLGKYIGGLKKKWEYCNDVLFLCVEKELPLPGCHTFSCHVTHTSALYLECWNILRSRIFSDLRQPIQHYVPFKITFPTPLPQCMHAMKSDAKARKQEPKKNPVQSKAYSGPPQEINASHLTEVS